MSEKSIRYIVYVLKTGLFALPFLCLIVAGSLFFPFITGKNFFFRIMVEILFFLWIFVACFDKNYRPRKSPILIALAATLFFLTLATIFGANPYRSFWSNYERMEGLVGHVHLFLYFLILASTLRTQKDWKWFFWDLIGISFIVTVYSFLQRFGVFAVHQGRIRLDATFGNATYLAIFLIFHLFLICFLFIRTKNWFIRSGLMSLFCLEFTIIFLTATRGAILGLFGGAVFFALLMSIFTKNKKLRYGMLIFFAVLLALISSFLIFKNSGFIQNNFVLSRLAGISFSERTVTSRFTIWKMSLQGFLERPFLGWGPENYNIVFNKYYQPELWQQEPWFDRAHNIVFDWLISAGILGSLAYWSIFGAAIFVVLRLCRKKYFTPLEANHTKLINYRDENKIQSGPLTGFTLTEAGLFLALFVAYIFHNFFVFDNLTSYFMFFSILGYLHFSYAQSRDTERRKNFQQKSESRDISMTSYLMITLAFIVVVFSLYFANLKPLLAARQLITTLGEIRNKGADVNFTLAEFDKIFSYGSFGDGEAREQLASYAESILGISSISQQDRTQVATKAILEMNKQIKGAPNDARSYLVLTALYIKSNQLDEAMKSATKALELSPKKQQIYFVITDIYLSAGQNDKAFALLQKAYELDPAYYDASQNLAIISIVADKINAAEKILGEPEANWPAKFDIPKLINAYARVGNYQKVKELWKMIIAKDPNNAQYRVNLAATYLQLNERENTIKELEKAIELNPQFKEQGEYFINEIRAGRNP